MTGIRDPIPPGEVSRVRGRWQVPALRWVTRGLIVTAVVATAVPGDAGTVVGTITVVVVVAVPLVRVAWLTARWASEHDSRFVALGLSLLAIVGAASLLALF